MNRKIRQYKKRELANALNDVLGKGIVPLFKVYAELTKRASTKNHCFTCSIDELAEYLGYGRDDLDAILLDLILFNVIDIRIGYKDSTKRKITILIH